MADDTAVATVHDLDAATLESLVTNGDCKRLTPAQKVAYYRARCDAAGLDYRAQPFQFINLQGREVLYALKAATDQLTGKHKIRTEITDQRTEEGLRIVTVRAIAADGRATDEIGAVPIAGLKGEALANALMKASTKAKRRAVLALCGLGMLDETEVDSIPGATRGASATASDPPKLRPPAPVNVPSGATTNAVEHGTAPAAAALGTAPPVLPAPEGTTRLLTAKERASMWKIVKGTARFADMTATDIEKAFKSFLRDELLLDSSKELRLAHVDAVSQWCRDEEVI